MDKIFPPQFPSYNPKDIINPLFIAQRMTANAASGINPEDANFAVPVLVQNQYITYYNQAGIKLEAITVFDSRNTMQRNLFQLWLIVYLFPFCWVEKFFC